MPAKSAQSAFCITFPSLAVTNAHLPSPQGVANFPASRNFIPGVPAQDHSRSRSFEILDASSCDSIALYVGADVGTAQSAIDSSPEVSTPVPAAHFMKGTRDFCTSLDSPLFSAS